VRAFHRRDYPTVRDRDICVYPSSARAVDRARSSRPPSRAATHQLIVDAVRSAAPRRRQAEPARALRGSHAKA